MNKLNLKKGDEVKVMSGKDKGKSGKILDVFTDNRRVAVAGVNIRVRFSRPKRRGEKGQRVELPAPLSISKVALICPNCGKITRVAHEVSERGIFRKCKKCGKLI
ncbi:MAG: 50S ribosomal protein L24 [Candidatus Doudnabacteria bacterium]|nr:50S ribosomal protein L24 [Candidatus Doudnabacteria bacterium]